MKLSEFKQRLASGPDKHIRFILPTNSKVPPHAHVTEVARVDKRFVDCGGTPRMEFACRLQVWFADDTEHRLSAGKLLMILEKAASLLETESIDVDVEYEAPFVSQFPISAVEEEPETLTVRLATKHTACLAEDRCLRPAATGSEAILFKPFALAEKSSCCS